MLVHTHTHTYTHTHTQTHLVILNDAREHGNGATVSLIDHLPEVSASILHWPLCDDEGFLLLVALSVKRHSR